MKYLMRVLTSFSSRRSQKYAAALLLVLASVVALAAPACNGSSSPADKLFKSCAQASDCDTGLICALGQCRPVCKTIADCSNGGSCIFDSSGHAVCQSPTENNTSCDNVTAPCKPPLACASDFRCRNLCASDANCNVLNITGRVCAKDATGTNYCADPQVPGEVAGGVITQPPPPGADASMSSSSGGKDGGSSSSGGSGSSSGSSSGGSSSDGSGSSSGSIESGVDTGPAPCVPACPQGQGCVNGACVACGMSGAPCCSGTPCTAGLACNPTTNTCGCGGANEICCGGSSCNAGLSCVLDAGPSVCACGSVGTACCPSGDAGVATCSGKSLCAGSKCSCILEYATGNSIGLVRRVDGTVWSSQSTVSSGAYTQVSNGAGPLRTSTTAPSGQVAAAYYGANTGCAIVSGGVWCFPLGGTLADSTYLGAGLGATATSSPVQVVTSIGGTPLMNATQIATGTYTSSPNFCAVTSDGSAWCWGYGAQGQLGHGDMANISYARQVWTAANTPIASVAEVRMGYEASCARLTDGTVWCWGTNNYAELGVPYGTTLPAIQSSYYAVRVPFVGTLTATRLGAGPVQTFCAIMQDTSVVCWGYNSSYFTAGSTTTTPSGVGPTTVLVALGGAPLTGAIDLASDRSGYAMCALTGSTLAIQCWGNRGTPSPYPSSYTDARNNAVAGVHGALSADYYALGYVDPAGVLTYQGTPTTAQPPCTNLLP